jgi:hypothetical protein
LLGRLTYTSCFAGAIPRPLIVKSLVDGLSVAHHGGPWPPRDRADMFTEDGRPSDEDPREHRARLGDERTTLVESLRCQPPHVGAEVRGSRRGGHGTARSVEPSTMSLLGLVRHLAEGERATFGLMMAGQDVPRLFCSDSRP